MEVQLVVAAEGGVRRGHSVDEDMRARGLDPHRCIGGHADQAILSRADEEHLVFVVSQRAIEGHAASTVVRGHQSHVTEGLQAVVGFDVIAQEVAVCIGSWHDFEVHFGEFEQHIRQERTAVHHTVLRDGDPIAIFRVIVWDDLDAAGVMPTSVTTDPPHLSEVERAVILP